MMDRCTDELVVVVTLWHGQEGLVCAQPLGSTGLYTVMQDAKLDGRLR